MKDPPFEAGFLFDGRVLVAAGTPHPRPFFGSNRPTGAIGGYATASKSLKGRGGDGADKSQAPLLPLREKVDRAEGPRRMRGALAANTMQKAQGPPGLNGFIG